jgi:uncharacterized membrane protein
MTHRKTLIVSFIFIFLFFFLTRSIAHFNLKTDVNDQYFFDNPFWNTTQGKPLFLSLEKRSFLGNHFSPILLVFSLPYFFTPTSLWIFAIQALTVSLVFILIYDFARKNLDREGKNLIVLLLFTNVSLRYMGFNDFHMDVVLALLLTIAVYLLYSKRDLWLPTLLILAAFLAKETAGIIIASYGLLLFLFRKQKLLGLLLFAVGLAAMAFLTAEIIPIFNPSEHFRFGKYYSHLGNNTFEQISFILFHPIKTFLYLLSPQNLLYVFLLLAPFAFLPLLSPQLLVLGALPLFQNLISNYRFQKDITTQYSYVFIPLLFFATILSIKQLQADRLWSKYKGSIKACVYFFAVLSLLAFVIFNLRLYVPQARTFSAHRIMKNIPKSASVSASSHLLVHLQYRDQLFVFPEIDRAEYVLFEDIDPSLPKSEGELKTTLNKLIKEKRYFYILKKAILGVALPDKDYLNAIKSLRCNPGYKLLEEENGICLYQRI